MAKVTPILYKHRQKASGKRPVYLRIADAGKTRYVSLREYVRPSRWDENAGRVRKNHPRAEEINKLIADKVSEAYDAVYRLKTEGIQASADALKEALAPEEEPKSAEDYFGFADEVIDALERRGQVYTYKRYKSVIKKFKGFTGEPLAFDAVTPKLLRDFELHLIEHYGNAASTVQTNFNAIRAIYYRAIREGKAEQGANPFFRFTPQKAPKPERGKVSLEELQSIESLELPEGCLRWHVRNYLLFSFYCAGIRFGDLAKLQWKNIKRDNGDVRLDYRMSKTGTRKSIKLFPPALAILDHYAPDGAESNGEKLVFPLIEDYDISTPKKLVSAIGTQNAIVNRCLKDIAKQAEVECKLSFHIARHSFADVARQRGWSIYDISKALGHANITVTERYLRGFDGDALDARMEELFGG